MTEETPPAIVPDTDPAQAFEEVRRELSMLESAIKGLTAERKNAPDYSVTLAEMKHVLPSIDARLDQIEHSKVLALSPVELAKEINAAAETVRSQDRRLLAEARDALARSLGQVDGMIGRGQAVAGRAHRECWIAAGGTLAGILLWSILPGAVVRSLPESWHASEWMAARMMGMGQVEAGKRMIETAGNADGP
jgi:hypothetical protein